MNQVILVVFFVAWSIVDLPLYVMYRCGHPVAYYRTATNRRSN